MLIHKPRFFTAAELVPEDTFKILGEKAIEILIDPRILITLDQLRERYGKLIVNDWSFGGSLQMSGWRPGNATTGAMFSQHKYGRAIDVHPQAVTVEEMRHDIQKRPDRKCYEFVTAVELEVGWFHFDVRNNQTGKILFFKP